MKSIRITNSVLKWIIFALLIISLITMFFPIYQSKYTSTSTGSNSATTTNKTTYEYGYSSFVTSIWNVYNVFTVLLTVLAIVFLFAEFKSSKIFSFGLIATNVINNFFSIMTISRYVNESSSNTTQYSLSYGYDLMLVETIILTLAVILAIIFYAIEKSLESKGDKKTEDYSLDDLKERLNFLAELRDSEVITESEYEQKRAEIVKQIKV
ncbi:MAG: SHOCT domain-containing protein [Clostridia bacterium]|nr:SHOCT domain-containing protein [Clostridia bacterium]